MLMTRFFGSTLLAAAKSETSAAGAAAATSTSVCYPLRSSLNLRGARMRTNLYLCWKASELRLWDDLTKLYVLLKEKNMLMTQHQMLHAQNLRFPNPERLPKVRKSMCRIKHVLKERAIDEPKPRRCAEMKRTINSLFLVMIFKFLR